MKTGRDTKRHSRRAGHVPSVAIAGYTNAGKSSILNRITGAGVLVENQLFATLDPTVRRAETADGREYTLVDTVGFVRSLPHQLVEAFRSTLEEVADADLLLHVVDGSHPDPEGQIAAVREVLAGVEGAGDVPEVIVVNKADVADRLSWRPGRGRGWRRSSRSSPRRCPNPTCRSSCSSPMTEATCSAGSTSMARSLTSSMSRPAPGSARKCTNKRSAGSRHTGFSRAREADAEVWRNRGSSRRVARGG